MGRDIFLGVVVPDIRRVVKEFQSAPPGEMITLLKSAIHEERLLALLMLVNAYNKGDDALKKKNLRPLPQEHKYINNWDLVDLSAPTLSGIPSGQGPETASCVRTVRDLWKRRIAVLSTFAFIRWNDFDDSLRIAKVC